MWLLVLAVADLPVHCIRAQVLGEWSFHVGPPRAERSSCGHLRPDVPEKQPKIELAQSTPLAVTFTNPDAAFSGGKRGYFSMVYDEGFEFTVGDRQFFAFSNFDLTTVKGQQVNTSHCGKTELGWYANKARTEFGCFYGEKTTPVAPAAMLRKEHKASSKPLQKADHQRKVALINERATTWKAKVYSSYVGKSQADLNRRAGLLRQTVAPPKLSFLSLGSALRRSHRIESELPKAWDWRSVNGTSYLEPVMDQGDCGSCYAVAAMRMLSARHRIKTGDTVPFSISFPLFCAEYNQGCDGGYAFLTSKWSEDVGLIPATCARYVTNGECSVTCSEEELGPKLRATNHHYVGGYYGGASASEIMSELQNGPVVVSLEPKSDLMYYQGGVYESTPDEVHQEWERVDHAVLLIGYGEEAGKKYWQLQNSWGPEWGEGGFFRMARGINDSGIESIAVAADVTEDSSSGVSDFLRQSAVLF